MRKPPAARRLLRRAGDALALAVILLATGVVLFPYTWMLLSSFKPAAAFAQPASLHFEPTLRHWMDVARSQLLRQIANSVVVGAMTVTVALLVGAPAAYGLSRFGVGGAPLRFSILAAQMLPPAVLVIPLFLLMYRLRLLDSLVAVATAHLTFVLPLVTWFLIAFFGEIPRDLEQQALVDGCSHWQAFHRILVPVVRPGMAAAGMFAFVLSWNDLFYGLLLAGGNSKTLPVGVAGYWTFRGVDMGRMSVAVVAAIVPVLVVSFFIQRHLVKGLGGGALKD